MFLKRFFWQYYLAILFCLIPFIFLFLFFMGVKADGSEMTFWLLFLVSPIPLGILALALCIWGFIKARKQNSRLNTLIGIVGLLGALACLAGGVLGIMLIYVVTS